MICYVQNAQSNKFDTDDGCWEKPGKSTKIKLKIYVNCPCNILLLFKINRSPKHI